MGGIYIYVKSYKKDESYICGEIKCRGIYEINLPKANEFMVRNFEILHPIKAFEGWTQSRCFDALQLWEIDPFGFYVDFNDLMDGLNILKVSYSEYYGIAWMADKILKQVVAIYNKTKEYNLFDLSDNEINELHYLIELLKEAVDENLIVSFSLSY